MASEVLSPGRLAELKLIADLATPGKRTISTNPKRWVDIPVSEEDLHRNRDNDARFAAEFDPPTVLVLIEAAQDSAHWRAAFDEMQERWMHCDGKLKDEKEAHDRLWRANGGLAEQLWAAIAERDVLRKQVEALRSHPRELLGRTVRAAWLAYCKETGRTDKPSYVASWEDISEWDREVDRQIGEAVRRELIAAMEDTHAA